MLMGKRWAVDGRLMGRWADDGHVDGSMGKSMGLWKNDGLRWVDGQVHVSLGGSMDGWKEKAMDSSMERWESDEQAMDARWTGRCIHG